MSPGNGIWPAGILLNGKTAPGRGRVIRVVNPANDAVVAEVVSGGVEDVVAAVEGAEEAWSKGWRDLAPGKRTQLLHGIARLIRENLETLAQAESQSIGKPIADARDEIGLGARVFEYYAEGVTRICGQTIPVGRGGFDFTLRESMGVVAAIAPWNFPFPIACWKTAPALAAGNTVVLKPASCSPLTALMLGELALKAGVPAGVLQVVPGSGAEIGDALVCHPAVRKVSFTGSTEIGRRIMGLAARDIKRISLELGGKSPNIVFADSDLEKAAASSPMSVFGNTGQDCCARSRVFVERAAYDRFVDLFVEATAKLVVGDPALEATQLGPMVSKAQRGQVEAFIHGAREAGRPIAIGGDRPHEEGAFLNPAVVLEPDLADAVWREEVFGPVVCIRPFDSEEEMLRQVNDTPYGLSGSIWTGDLKRALRVARRVESGVLSVNCHNSVHVEAPFGGYKQSGIGRDLGMAALEGYTELKNVYVAD